MIVNLFFRCVVCRCRRPDVGRPTCTCALGNAFSADTESAAQVVERRFARIGRSVQTIVRGGRNTPRSWPKAGPRSSFDSMPARRTTDLTRPGSVGRIQASGGRSFVGTSCVRNLGATAASREAGASHPGREPLSMRTSRAARIGAGAMTDAPLSPHIGAAALAGREMSRATRLTQPQRMKRSAARRLIAENRPES